LRPSSRYIRLATQSSAAEGVEGEGLGEELGLGLTDELGLGLTEELGLGLGDEGHATMKLCEQTDAVSTTRTGALTAEARGVLAGLGVGSVATLVGLRTRYTIPTARIIVANIPSPIMSDFFSCVVIVWLLSISGHK
jgi:hypothetical protein